MKTSPPKVTVVIPAYNAGPHLTRAIDSVLSQTYAPTEIVVVNDGSIDNTDKICCDYGSRIRYISQMNKGVSAARNAGASAATGEILVFLDSDDELFSCALESLVYPFVQDPSVGGCSGILLMKGTRREDFYRPPIDEHKSGPIALYRFSEKYSSAGSGVAVRKSCFDAVGGYTTGLRFGEDQEFCNKIYGSYEWYFVNALIATYHRSSATSITVKTPFYEHGLGYIWPDTRMRQFVASEKRKEYTAYRAAVLLSIARKSFIEDQHAYGQSAVQQIGALLPNIRFVKWSLAYLLPKPLWKTLRLIACRYLKPKF